MHVASNSADFTDFAVLSRELMACVERAQMMVEAVAAARQIKEFDSDRRRRALSVCVAPLLDAGQSGTAAEHQARASKPYGDAMAKLRTDYIQAETTIAAYAANAARMDALRSLISFQKQLVQQ